MLIIKHRVNTTKGLKALPKEFGVEVDVRSWKKDLILHHEPFQKGEKLDKFLKNYNHSFIILESKEERIEPRIIELAEKHGICDYFLLSVNPPFMRKLAEDGVRKMAVRFSELESLETCKLWAGKVEWVWIDTFTKLPLDKRAYKLLKKCFKICIVSPELLGRPGEINSYKAFFKKNKMNIDAVCTDFPERWA